MTEDTDVPLQFVRTQRSPIAEFSFVFNADETRMWTVSWQPVLHNHTSRCDRKKTRNEKKLYEDKKVTEGYYICLRNVLLLSSAFL